MSRRCCCACDCVCDVCLGDKAPCCFTVIISGATNGSCSSCLNHFNSTFSLRQNPQNLCSWTSVLCNTGCSDLGIELTISGDGNQTTLSLTIGNHQWQKVIDGEISCCKLDETLENTSSGSDCNSSLSTARVMANNVDNCYGNCNDNCVTGAPTYLAVSIFGMTNTTGVGGTYDCDCWNNHTFYARLACQSPVGYDNACAWTREEVDQACVQSSPMSSINPQINVGGDHNVLVWLTYDAINGYQLNVMLFNDLYRADLGMSKPECRTWYNIVCNFVQHYAGSFKCNPGYVTVSALSLGVESDGPSPGAQFCQLCGSNFPESVDIEITGIDSISPRECCNDYKDTFTLTRGYGGNPCTHGYAITSTGSCYINAFVLTWSHDVNSNTVASLYIIYRNSWVPYLLAQWIIGGAPASCGSFYGYKSAQIRPQGPYPPFCPYDGSIPNNNYYNIKLSW